VIKLDVSYFISYFILIILVVIPSYTLLVQGIDRKIVARMQNRIGPPIIQPFYDFLKLLGKEQMAPKTATRLFIWAPVLSAAFILTAFLYVPFGIRAPLSSRGDLIFIIYLLLAYTAIYVLGPMTSGSPFAMVGAQRKLIIAASIEPPFIAMIGTIAWMTGKIYSEPFSLSAIMEFSKYAWTKPPLAILWFMFLIVAILWIAGEAGRGFFDVAEAETELGGGVDVEYSGIGLALYKLSHMLAVILCGSLIVDIFIPWKASEIFGLTGITSYIVDVVYHMLLVFIIVFFAYTFIRALSGRFKIDQIVKFYWSRVLPFALSIAILALVLSYFGVIMI